MSSVQFKFKIARTYSTITFNGPVIAANELKDKIIQQQRLGDNPDYDLTLTNADTNEVYGENDFVPKNASIIIRRVPRGTRASNKELTIEASRAAAPALARSPSPPPPVRAPVASSQDANTSGGKVGLSVDLRSSEDSAISRLVASSSVWETTDSDAQTGQTSTHTNTAVTGFSQYRPRQVRFNPNADPPVGYICHRCGQAGHWIQSCPTNDDPNFVYKKQRVAVGIPKSKLRTVASSEATEHGTFVLPGGGFAQMIPDESVFEQKTLALRSRSNDPEALICPLCQRIFRDAVLLPCCGTSYCDACIRPDVPNEPITCPNCKKESMPNKLLPNHSLRKAVADYLASQKPSNDAPTDSLANLPLPSSSVSSSSSSSLLASAVTRSPPSPSATNQNPLTKSPSTNSPRRSPSRSPRSSRSRSRSPRRRSRRSSRSRSPSRSRSRSPRSSRQQQYYGHAFYPPQGQFPPHFDSFDFPPHHGGGGGGGFVSFGGPMPHANYFPPHPQQFGVPPFAPPFHQQPPPFQRGGPFPPRGNVPYANRLASVLCYNCQQYGHFARNCPNPPAPRGTRPPNPFSISPVVPLTDGEHGHPPSSRHSSSSPRQRRSRSPSRSRSRTPERREKRRSSSREDRHREGDRRKEREKDKDKRGHTSSSSTSRRNREHRESDSKSHRSSRSGSSRSVTTSDSSSHKRPRSDEHLPLEATPEKRPRRADKGERTDRPRDSDKARRSRSERDERRSSSSHHHRSSSSSKSSRR